MRGISAAVLTLGLVSAAAHAQYYPQRGYDQPYHPVEDTQMAIRQCSSAAYEEASHYGRVQPGPIGDVDRIKGGFKVKGAVVVSDPYRGHYDHYDSGYRRGSFSCEFRYGSIAKLKLHGIG